ncbi:DEAD/DEAH box helicase [Arthrobacter sp. lap29]|uniref:DEAD/DEAH box helicase n=1 Tax=Arthrobacter sp. lap29 TaxID=3056122 RepID=UPI0028F71F7E|nr:DEAD/DEAH box helicase [Arthrobacter sp. lap29]
MTGKLAGSEQAHEDMKKKFWHQTDESLVAQIENQLRAAVSSYEADPQLLREHANQEESFRTGGYAKRQVLELVQNAADALLRHDSRGKVAVVLTDDALYCANEGRPFDEAGIDAVTHAYISDKRGDEIGRFGLGFKSILAITSNAQILSQSVSFEFNSIAAQQALRSVSVPGQRTPKFRIPTVFDASAAMISDTVLAELASWASTIIKMPLDGGQESLATQIREFPTEFLLFANTVSALVMEDRRTTTELYQHEHLCQKLDNNEFNLHRPSKKAERWLVVEHMHRPSSAALQVAAETVARAEIKIAYAAPLDVAMAGRLGSFWAYYPLDEQTTAWGIFNAPWAVNDDRTSMLYNKYNEEILDVFVDIFLDAAPRFRTKEDPARHLDYLPSRAREFRGYGDEILTTRVPYRSRSAALIPDSQGTLSKSDSLRVLSFDESWQGREPGAKMHALWQSSPHTDSQVPHWTCFTSGTRYLRLRELFLDDSVTSGPDGRQTYPGVDFIGLATWLTELGTSGDLNYASSALRIASNIPDVAARNRAYEARIVPTAEGFVRISDSKTVFLPANDYPPINGLTTVSAIFLAKPENRSILEKLGFKEVAPESAIGALLSQCDDETTAAKWEQLWDMFLDISERQSETILKRHISLGGMIKVMTLAGSWQPAERVVNSEVTGVTIKDPARALDPSFHSRPLAEAAGVITGVDSRYPVIEEEIFAEYRSWAEREYRRQLPKRPASEALSARFVDEYAPGPISIFLEFDPETEMKGLGAWTAQILKAGTGPEEWAFRYDRDIPAAMVLAPDIWAAREFGLIDTLWGHRRPSAALSPALTEYTRYLPVSLEPSARKLRLVDNLDQMPLETWLEFLERDHPVTIANSRDHETLCHLISSALLALTGAGKRPSLIPAVVNGAVRKARASDVYVACEPEELDYLQTGERPYIYCPNAQHRDIILAGSDCRLASEAISFALNVSEPNDAEAIGDVFLGLRDFVSRAVLETDLVRCAGLARRVITPDGTKDRPAQFALEGGVMYVVDSATDHDVLESISLEFESELASRDIDDILRQRDRAAVQELRTASLACSTDQARLELLVGTKNLRTKLPSGLLAALNALGADTSESAIPKIFLDVHGSDALKELSDDLAAKSLVIPQNWAGSSSAKKFVRDLGFDAQFAGEREATIPNSELVLGRPGLKPLHDYQESASEEIRKILRTEGGSSGKAMIELPTGAGKTRVAVESIVKSFLAEEIQGPILWIAPTAELCEQAFQCWSEVWREFSDERALLIGRLWSKHDVSEPDTNLSVIIVTDAKLDTSIVNNPNYDWLAIPTAVIVDEAHVAGESQRYTRIFTWLGVDGRHHSRPLLGLSATPFKGRKPEATDRLAARFGRNLVNSLGDDPIAELQKRGVLSRVTRQVLDGTNIELDQKELNAVAQFNKLSATVLAKIEADEERTTRIIDHVVQLPEDWPVLIFTSSVLSAQISAALLRSMNISAASISGTTRPQERRRITNSFRRGDTRVLVNCDVLTQGFDAPLVRALYIARPTLSPGLYMQMVGRGLRGRLNGGSDECLIVDLQDSITNLGRNLAYRDYEQFWNGSN